MMFGLQDNRYAFGLQYALDDTGYLGRETFLNLKPTGASLDDARQLGDTDDPVARKVTDPSPTYDGSHMMLAMAAERNSFKKYHLVITRRLLEGLLKIFFRVLRIAAEVGPVGASDTRRRLDKTFAGRIFTDPAKYRPYGFLNLALAYGDAGRPCFD
ncbi:hypothetical protein FBZ96_11032 [Bradyrhizobium stylosanthis]|uniref:Uncharacterized protein n=1 Tax=Bradyrhizobium stylosanthis TaxID=1803665 RepID=A0A560D623_9BRAD|nr:hypothetical protein FBZ96_11032 [Bradyrhizobium stylosanthis]